MIVTVSGLRAGSDEGAITVEKEAGHPSLTLSEFFQEVEKVLRSAGFDLVMKDMLAEKVTARPGSMYLRPATRNGKTIEIFVFDKNQHHGDDSAVALYNRGEPAKLTVLFNPYKTQLGGAIVAISMLSTIGRPGE